MIGDGKDFLKSTYKLRIEGLRGFQSDWPKASGLRKAKNSHQRKRCVQKHKVPTHRNANASPQQLFSPVCGKKRKIQAMSEAFKFYVNEQPFPPEMMSFPHLDVHL